MLYDGVLREQDRNALLDDTVDCRIKVSAREREQQHRTQLGNCLFFHPESHRIFSYTGEISEIFTQVLQAVSDMSEVPSAAAKLLYKFRHQSMKP